MVLQCLHFVNIPRELLNFVVLKDYKMFFPTPFFLRAGCLKFTPVFRPGIGRNKVIIFKLELKQRDWFQTKWTKSIPNFRPKRRKNTVVWGCTYLYGLYKGVPPPPPPRFGQIVVQIFSVKVRELKLSKTNLVSSMHIKRGKALLTVDVRRSKTVFLCTATSVKF